MKHEHRITAKGQVTIPKDIREALGLEPGGLVAFELDEQGRARIMKVDDEGEQAAWLRRLHDAQRKFGGKDRFEGMSGSEYQRWIRPDRIDV